MSKKTNRNDPCPCGSGKKYKQCCMTLEKPIAAKYDAQGKIKFSAEVVSLGTSDCVDVFKKFSGAGSVSMENTGKNFTITKEKTLSKKAIKKFQKEEDQRLSENLKQHNFEVFEAKDKDVFIPTTEDFRVNGELNIEDANTNEKESF